MDRRDFLKSVAVLGLAGCTRNTNLPVAAKKATKIAKASAPAGPRTDWGPMPAQAFKQHLGVPSVVGMSHADDPKSLNVEALVRAAIEQAGNLAKIIHRGDVVAIKPNLVVDMENGTGITTDTRVAEAIAKMCLDCGAKKIVFVEGTSARSVKGDFGLKGQWRKGATLDAFQRSGFNDLARKLGASLVDLNDAGENKGLLEEIRPQFGLTGDSYWISKKLFSVDRLISVPVLKNHEGAGATLSLKNYMGIAPADVYNRPGIRFGKLALDHSALGLPKVITDLVMIRPPDFAVIDALVGVSSGILREPILPGPKGPMRAILASSDPVALDTMGCHAMGYDPATIGHIVVAGAIGLGHTDLKMIQSKGTELQSFAQDFVILQNMPCTPGRLKRA